MKMQPWQQQIYDKLTSGGVKPSELMIIGSGRRVGKSAFSAQAFQRLWDDIHNRSIEDLKLSEGTVYGNCYYTVEPVGGNWADMEVWCTQTFGDPGDRIWDSGPAPLPARRWYMNNRKFWFRNEADRTMFILKWR